MGAKSQKRNINTQIIFTMMGLLIFVRVFFSITTKKLPDTEEPVKHCHTDFGSCNCSYRRDIHHCQRLY